MRQVVAGLCLLGAGKGGTHGWFSAELGASERRLRVCQEGACVCVCVRRTHLRPFLQNSLLLEAVWHLHVQNIVSLQELLERYVHWLLSVHSNT